MPRYLWLIIVSLFFGCTRDHNAPVADIDYLELAREPGAELYGVKFSSNIDFLSIFEKGKKPISSMLRCSLEGDEVSIDRDADRYIAEGLVSIEQPLRENEVFIYSAALMLDENLNEGRSSRMLRADELRRILQGKQFVPCVYTATAFGFKAYRSATMRVPVADIFREVGIQ